MGYYTLGYGLKDRIYYRIGHDGICWNPLFTEICPGEMYMGFPYIMVLKSGQKLPHVPCRSKPVI